MQATKTETAHAELTPAEIALLSDLAYAPILKCEADMRRPFRTLMNRGLVKIGASKDRAAYALTKKGMETADA